MEKWNSRVAVGFPEFGNRIKCFAFDWLGRVFAADLDRSEDEQPGVVMFEPGSGEALEIPCSVSVFHTKELIEFTDAALAENFYKQWLASDGDAPGYGQCIGYKLPLFLGGADKIGNLEVSDIDVYWHLFGQLIREARRLPPGTFLAIES